MLLREPKRFKNRLVASCQDNEQWTIPKAIEGGCGGLRVNGPNGLYLAKKHDVPIIACWKKDVPGNPIRITPEVDLAVSLVDGDTDYVAFDATIRRGKDSIQSMINIIHDCGGKAVADVSTAAEGFDVWEMGADIVATTLFPSVNCKSIERLATAGIYVMAEGGIRTPAMARDCVNAGAELVCVGSAISRPHHVTKWFVEALA